MNSFLTNPNLPERPVTDVIVSKADKSLIDKLSNLDIVSHRVPENPNLSSFIASHADANIYHLGGNQFIAESYCKSFNNILDIKKYVSVHSPYPGDCLLNGADIGNFLICNRKIILNDILIRAEREGKTVINVNQGYSKCSVCVVKRNTIITDDESIYKAVSEFREISSLLVSKGDIRLDNQNYGFIGGCSGLIDKDLILFNGDLMTHTDFNSISDFLEYHNVKYVDISNKELNDVGSIIPIKEKGEV